MSSGIAPTAEERRLIVFSEEKTPLLVFLLGTALVTVVLLEVAQMVFAAVPEGSRQAIGPILTIINATILAGIGWWTLRKKASD